MSIVKIKCPSLVELSQSIGPIDGIESIRAPKPLCDNIFDVQRNELVEVLERLRTTFWSDEVTLPIVTLPPTPQPQTLQNYKRTFSEPDEDAYQDTESELATKRQRLNTPQEEIRIKKSPITPPSPKSLQTFASLWSLKKSIIRQIKTANRYNESQLLGVLTDVYQTKSTEQIHHLALYLIPVAKAMRRENVTKLLEQWCL